MRTNTNMRKLYILLGIVFIASFCPSANAENRKVDLLFKKAIAPVQFAVSDISKALDAKGFSSTVKDLGPAVALSGELRIIIGASADEDKRLAADLNVAPLKFNTPQSYSLRKHGSGSHATYVVLGADPAGAMYGGLDLAEAIRTDTLDQLQASDHSPHVAERGIKLNIPLDARTPSYSDDSDSAQQNIAVMWTMDFWTRFLDEMARDRYNTISLWNEAPFASLERVPEYPNVALADVKKKMGGFWPSNLEGVGMYNPSWTLETVKTMTMDEKIAFWRKVMQYAKDRGIDVYIYTWNIFVYGTEPSGYGITDSPTNATTKDYLRKSIRTLFNTYPLLAGIGLTAGENMPKMSNTEKEQWLWDTYGLGVEDAMAAAKDPASPYYNPHRVIHLVHRAWYTGLTTIVSQFNTLPGYNDLDSTLAFSYKPSIAQMYSSTQPLFIYNTSATNMLGGSRLAPGGNGHRLQGGYLDSLPPGKKTWLTVRDDSIFYMRWGSPDYVRAYITHMPDMSKVAGYNIGPDGYTWGREFVSTEPDSPRKAIIDKMWYSFMLWGRLGYEPTLPNSEFQAILHARFPEVPVGKLYSGWASVSMVIPLVTRFYFGANDFQWYPEACWSHVTRASGFQTVQDFIKPRWAPMNANEDGETPRLMSVKEFVDGDAPNGRLTPLQVANELQRYADAGIGNVDGLSSGESKELRLTLGDIKAMAWLGRYYAEKIRGAVFLYRYQKSGDMTAYQDATSHLKTASADWSEYAGIWSKQYVGQVLDRLGTTRVDIKAIQEFVDKDIPAPIPTNPAESASGAPTQ